MLNLNIRLDSKKWLVLGGGTVATRRVKKILKENGYIELISPQVSKSILRIESENKKIKVVKRKFRKSDIRNQDFILACTDNLEVNKSIVAIAKSKKIYPIKYPNIPPRTESIDAIKNIFIYFFFLAITIGIIITSGGIGKNELSMKDTIPK